VVNSRVFGNVKRLKVIRVFDPWGSPLCTCPPKYSLHPYTGCSHYCLYCYATAYLGRKPSIPKKDFWRRLRHDLEFINHDLVIELSTSSDPYPPLESWTLLTRGALEILVSRRARILITTKSDLVVRDKDLLLETPSAVMITITTLDDSLARKLEPGAPPPSQRIRALEILSSYGVPVGARIDPIIPGLNDDPDMLMELVDRVVEAGAKHIVSSTYKARPDNLKRMTEAFPELESLWRKLYLENSVPIHGYRYLRDSLRRKLLEPVVSRAREHGVTYAVCREGFRDRLFFNSPSCDGSHLIRYSRSWVHQGSRSNSYRLL